MKVGMLSGSFAVVLHPLYPKRDVGRRYPFLARVLPAGLIRLCARVWPPIVLSQVTGVQSSYTGEEAAGWLLACPLTAGQMLQLPPRILYDKIVQAGRLGQKHGARILGLSGLASGVGDGGTTIAQRLNMPVTTGNSLTVAAAVQALIDAADYRGLALDRASLAVVGASGSVGLACAEMLAPLVGELILVDEPEIRVSQARAQVEAAGAGRVRTSTRVAAIAEGDLVLTAARVTQPIVGSRHLKRNAIICDLARPPDVSPAVRRKRRDLLFITGGVLEVPGIAEMGFDFGLPPGRVYPCMAEAMILALEGRYESFSLGRRIHKEKVHEIGRLARRHGFHLSADPGGDDGLRQPTSSDTRPRARVGYR